MRQKPENIEIVHDEEKRLIDPAEYERVYEEHMFLKELSKWQRK